MSIANGLWSVLQVGTPMLASALSSIVIARSLPVSEFGLYSYVISLCSVGVAIVSAGLNGLAVRELSQKNSQHALVMTVLLVVRQACALFAYALLLVIALTTGSNVTISATAVAALSLFVRAFDAPDFWFQATSRTRITAIARSIASLCWLTARVVVALTIPSLWVFIALFAIEPLVISSIVMWRYLRNQDNPGYGRVSLSETKRIMTMAFPVTLSSVADQINGRGDVVIINALSNSAQVGLYSAAARLSEMAYFAPNAYMAGTTPELMRIRAKFGAQSRQYRGSIQRSLDLAFWLGVLFAITLSLLGGFVIAVLYGPSYEESARVLAIHVFACPFVFMAAVGTKWLVIEGLLWTSLVRHLFGAVSNIGLNLLLFPVFGIEGSAWATVVSYFIASYLSFFTSRSTIPFAGQMTLAIVYPVRVALLLFRGQRVRRLRR